MAFSRSRIEAGPVPAGESRERSEDRIDAPLAPEAPSSALRAGPAARSDLHDPPLREIRVAGPAARRGAGGVPAAVARPRPQALSRAARGPRGRGPERARKARLRREAGRAEGR